MSSVVPSNLLVAVTTFAKSSLASLSNQNCFLDKRVMNPEFLHFNEIEANLGSTINIQKPFRYLTNDTLVATQQATVERYQPLVIDQSANVSTGYTAQQLITNVDRFLPKISMAAAAELGAKIEQRVASCIPAHTYRFYGDGYNAISSFGQLAFAQAQFKTYGAAKTNLVGILDPITQSIVSNSGLSQFAVNRNNELAMSWEIGEIAGVDYFTSNFLPLHTSGYAGESWAGGATGITLTFASISADGTQVTFTGAGSQSKFFKADDLLQFSGVGLTYLAFTGHVPVNVPVQVRVTADADSSGGSVTANIYPALRTLDISNPTAEANLSRALVTSDTARSYPSHYCGLLMGGMPLYVAMPTLPDNDPFKTWAEKDEDTGAALRVYSGAQLGQNSYLTIVDAAWAQTLMDEYAVRYLIPA